MKVVWFLVALGSVAALVNPGGKLQPTWIGQVALFILFLFGLLMTLPPEALETEGASDPGRPPDTDDPTGVDDSPDADGPTGTNDSPGRTWGFLGAILDTSSDGGSDGGDGGDSGGGGGDGGGGGGDGGGGE